MRRLALKTFTLGLLLGIQAPLLAAAEFAYSGRITEPSGKPVAGPVALTVRFFDAETGGQAIGPESRFPAVALVQGTFQVTLDLSGSDSALLFGDPRRAVYVEVITPTRTLPRQRVSATPFALRIPVSPDYLSYNADGRLELVALPTSLVTDLDTTLAATSPVVHDHALGGDLSGTLAASVVAKIRTRAVSPMAPVATDVLKWNGSAWAPASDLSSGTGTITSLAFLDGSIAAVDIAAAAITFSHLKVVPCANGLVMRIVAGAWTCAPLHAADFVTGMSDATFAFLDGLTSSAQSQITGKQDSITSAASIDAGQFSATQDLTLAPYGAPAGSTGQVRLLERFASGTNFVAFKAPDALAANLVWQLPSTAGSAGQVLSSNGSGVLSWLAVPAAPVSAVAGRTGAVVLTTDDAAAGTNAYFTPTAAQGAAVANALTSGATDTAPSQAATLGALASKADAAAITVDLGGKENTIAPSTAAGYYRGDKAMATLDTAAVGEGTNLFHTPARARTSLSVAAPLAYSAATGVLSLPAATTLVDGHTAAVDWVTFDAKQAPITAATALTAGSATTTLAAGITLKPYGTGTANTGSLNFDDLAGGGTYKVGFKAPDTMAADKIWTLPAADGTSGQILKTNAAGILAWTNASDGTVTSLATNAGLTGGPFVTSGTIALADSTVAAAAYTRANLTVDAKGRLTAAQNGTALALGTEATGTLAVANGGTGAASHTNNGVLTGSGASPLSATAAGTTNQSLTAGPGGAPGFSAIALNASAAVSGQLPVANGGTGLASGTSGGLPYFASTTTTASSTTLPSGSVVLGGGAGAAPSAVSGTAAQVLRVPSGGGSPSFGAIDASDTNAITGTLALGHGGTGITATPTNGQLAIGNGSGFTRATLTAGTSTGVTVANSSGAVTLGTSQDIRTTATPTFASLTLGSGQLSAANLAIGTTTPAAAVDVIGGIRAAKGTGTLDTSNTGLSFASDGDTGLFTVGGGAFDSSDLSFKSDNTEILRLKNNSGNVGIGSSSPDAKLDVVGWMDVHSASTSQATIRFDNTSTNGRDFRMLATGASHATGAGNLVFWDQNASASRLLMNAAGNIAIGTTTAANPFTVVGTAADHRILTVADPAALTKTVALGYSAAADAGVLQATNGGAAKMLLLNPRGGGIGIGTTTPNAPLSVLGTTGAASSTQAGFGSARWRLATTSGDQADAGSFDYRQHDANSFSVVGAGTASRHVRLYDQLTVGYNTITGGAAAFAGNVGIGTAAPGAALDLGVNGHLRMSSGGPGGYHTIEGQEQGYTVERLGIAVSMYGTNDISMYATMTGEAFSASTTKMVLKENGNVGIGTTNPNTKLQVNGNIDAGTFNTGTIYIAHSDNGTVTCEQWCSWSAGVCKAARRRDTDAYIACSHLTGFLNGPEVTCLCMRL